MSSLGHAHPCDGTVLRVLLTCNVAAPAASVCQAAAAMWGLCLAVSAAICDASGRVCSSRQALRGSDGTQALKSCRHQHVADRCTCQTLCGKLRITHVVIARCTVHCHRLAYGGRVPARSPAASPCCCPCPWSPDLGPVLAGESLVVRRREPTLRLPWSSTPASSSSTCALLPRHPPQANLCPYIILSPPLPPAACRQQTHTCSARASSPVPATCFTASHGTHVNALRSAPLACPSVRVH